MAIIFDLDGVLVDSTESVESAWRQWAGERGIEAAEFLPTIHGRPSREVIAEHAPDLDAAAEARRLDEMEQEGEPAAFEGAQDAIGLAQKGLWAIVTSGDRRAAERLRAAGLPVPEVLVTADDVENGKPDPEPYAQAAELLGVPPADCVVVEDAPAGIASAKRAGMRVIAVTTTYDADALGEADVVVGSLREALPELRDAAPSR